MRRLLFASTFLVIVVVAISILFLRSFFHISSLQRVEIGRFSDGHLDTSFVTPKGTDFSLLFGVPSGSDIAIAEPFNVALQRRSSPATSVTWEAKLIKANWLDGQQLDGYIISWDTPTRDVTLLPETEYHISITGATNPPSDMRLYLSWLSKVLIK